MSISDSIVIVMFGLSFVVIPLGLLFDVPRRFKRKMETYNFACKFKSHKYLRDDGNWYYVPTRELMYKLPGEIRTTEPKTKREVRLARKCERCDHYEYCCAPGIWTTR